MLGGKYASLDRNMDRSAADLTVGDVQNMLVEIVRKTDAPQPVYADPFNPAPTPMGFGDDLLLPSMPRPEQIGMPPIPGIDKWKKEVSTLAYSRPVKVDSDEKKIPVSAAPSKAAKEYPSAEDLADRHMSHGTQMGLGDMLSRFVPKVFFESPSVG